MSTCKVSSSGMHSVEIPLNRPRRVRWPWWVCIGEPWTYRVAVRVLVLAIYFARPPPRRQKFYYLWWNYLYHLDDHHPQQIDRCCAVAGQAVELVFFFQLRSYSEAVKNSQRYLCVVHVISLKLPEQCYWSGFQGSCLSLSNGTQVVY